MLQQARGKKSVTFMDKSLNHIVFAYKKEVWKMMAKTPFFLRHGFQLGARGKSHTERTLSLHTPEKVSAKANQVESQRTAAQERDQNDQAHHTGNFNMKHSSNLVNRDFFMMEDRHKVGLVCVTYQNIYGSYLGDIDPRTGRWLSRSKWLPQNCGL